MFKSTTGDLCPEFAMGQEVVDQKLRWNSTLQMVNASRSNPFGSAGVRVSLL
jgi:hypothetical protein